MRLVLEYVSNSFRKRSFTDSVDALSMKSPAMLAAWLDLLGPEITHSVADDGTVTVRGADALYCHNAYLDSFIDGPVDEDDGFSFHITAGFFRAALFIGDIICVDGIPDPGLADEAVDIIKAGQEVGLFDETAAIEDWYRDYGSSYIGHFPSMAACMTHLIRVGEPSMEADLVEHEGHFFLRPMEGPDESPDRRS